MAISEPASDEPRSVVDASIDEVVAVSVPIVDVNTRSFCEKKLVVVALVVVLFVKSAEIAEKVFAYKTERTLRNVTDDEATVVVEKVELPVTESVPVAVIVPTVSVPTVELASVVVLVAVSEPIEAVPIVALDAMSD